MRCFALSEYYASKHEQNFKLSIRIVGSLITLSYMYNIGEQSVHSGLESIMVIRHAHDLSHS